jgi:magnesium chelatase family protein
MNPTRGGDERGDYAAQMLETYKHKISGPILDRIDLWLPVPHVNYETLTEKRAVGEEGGSETARAREQIIRARERQRTRLDGLGITTNAEMSARDIERLIEFSPSVLTLLKTSAEKLRLSPRSYHRLVKVARTLADLEDKEQIDEKHVLEALQYRPKL